MKILLFSGCDDGYAHLLLEMMESLGDQLQKHDFGLLDLGLSEVNKKKIRKLKPDVIFKKPKWFIDLPEHRKNIFSQACLSRPFIKNIFPNYDGYMQIDADLWFLDNSAIDDYIKAAKNTGFSIIAEWHPLLAKNVYLRYKKRFLRRSRLILNLNYISILQYLFGKEKTVEIGMPTPICAGLYFMHKDSPAWENWQKAIKSVNWYEVKKEQRTCDQSCLLYAIHKYDVPVTYMTMEHNWIMFPDMNEPMIDKKSKQLLDPIYPHAPIKVIHIGGKFFKDDFTLKTTDGDIFTTKLTRMELLKTIGKKR